MAKIAFRDKHGLNKKNFKRLNQINAIIEEYNKQGYKLTLRQLYYQLVSRGVIPNNVKEYGKLSTVLTKGRMAGIVDWDAIEDRIRLPRLPYWVTDVDNAVDDMVEQYRLNRQEGQSNYVELWVEKDALSNVLRVKTEHYHINLMVNRGYSSCTAMYDAYNRMVTAIIRGQRAHILYLGDHDPSGLDMVRDIRARLLEFMNNSVVLKQYFFRNAKKFEKMILNTVKEYQHAFMGGSSGVDYYELFNGKKPNVYKFFCFAILSVRHIGLTSEQVKQHNPPPNPAKLTDPRAKWYLEHFGNTSWEVDALNPQTLHEIIDGHINELVEVTKFEKVIDVESIQREELRKLPEIKEKVIELAGEVDTDMVATGLQTKKKGSEKDWLNGKIGGLRDVRKSIKEKFDI